MLDTRPLLLKPPTDALVDILNFNNGKYIQYNSVYFENMTPLDGRRTQITIRALPHQSGVHRYIGQKTFVYHRLDLAELFTGDELDLTLVNPTSTYEILNALQSIDEFIFVQNDFVIETIPQGVTSYTLKAGPNSLRFKGEVTFNIAPPPLSLDDIIWNTLLGGVNYPTTSPMVPIRWIVLYGGLDPVEYPDVNNTIAMLIQNGVINLPDVGYP